MKILLTLVLCSQIQNVCLEPYPWPERFDTQYDCLMFGYEESMNKMQEIGREEINQTHPTLDTLNLHIMKDGSQFIGCMCR